MKWSLPATSISFARNCPTSEFLMSTAVWSSTLMRLPRVLLAQDFFRLGDGGIEAGASGRLLPLAEESFVLLWDLVVTKF